MKTTTRSLLPATTISCLLHQSTISWNYCMLLLATARHSSCFVARHSSKHLTLRQTMMTWSNLRSQTTDSALSCRGSIEISVNDAITSYHGRENVAFLDGSWYLPTSGQTGRELFEQGARIAGAQFWDIDDIATKGRDVNPKNLPHMLPPAKLHEAAMDAMHITNQHSIIVYGQPQCMFVHRLFLQLWIMGHDLDKLFVLDGSLQDWIDAGGPTDTEPTKVTLRADHLDLSNPTMYKANLRKGAVVDLDEMKRLVRAAATASANDDDTTMILDARSLERFLGQAPEPRPNLRGGHMPGALNLPFVDVLRADNWTRLKPKSELESVFNQVKGWSGDGDNAPWKDETRRIVTTCGSGATACTLAAALIKCGRDPNTLAIYDGSWAEWGGEADVPVTVEDDRPSLAVQK